MYNAEQSNGLTPICVVSYMNVLRSSLDSKENSRNFGQTGLSFIEQGTGWGILEYHLRNLYKVQPVIYLCFWGTFL